MPSLITRRRACLNVVEALAAIVVVPRVVLAETNRVQAKGAQAKAPANAKPMLVVYKDAACGCCSAWVDHMHSNGWRSTVSNVDMAPIKAKHKIPGRLQSCHTTIVGGYVVEGHVPAADVARLLAEKPKGIIGITIPGMPASAPGMDVMPFQPYTVLTFDANGKTAVFAKHDKPGR